MTAYEEAGMSAQARMDGGPAAWQQAEAAPGRRPSQRTPLAVVPAPLPRSGSGVAVLCAVVLLVALALVLVMNISMSNRQYALIDLRDRQVEVTEANERLAEQVGYLNAPQNLAARADALGMVPAAGAGIVDAASGQIAPATARGDAAGLVTAHVGPPADADEARQGLAASAAAQAELAGPRTLTPEEAAAAASGSAAPAVEGGAATPGPAEATDGSDEH